MNVYEYLLPSVHETLNRWPEAAYYGDDERLWVATFALSSGQLATTSPGSTVHRELADTEVGSLGRQSARFATGAPLHIASPNSGTTGLEKGGAVARTHETNSEIRVIAGWKPTGDPFRGWDCRHLGFEQARQRPNGPLANQRSPLHGRLMATR